MAIGDIPKIPREYFPRLQQLTDKLRSREITLYELYANAFATAGRCTVSAEGVTFAGDFGKVALDKEGLTGIVESVKNMAPLWHMFAGRSFLYQHGDLVLRIRLGNIPLIRRATISDVENGPLPAIIFQQPAHHDPSSKAAGPGLPYWLKYLSDDPDWGQGTGVPNPLFKVRRVEEIMGWFEDWEQLARVMAASLPLVPMSQKKRLDKMGENFPQYMDAFLKKCGV